MADTLPVVFEGTSFLEDLAYASTAGSVVAVGARQRLEADGIVVAELRPCQRDARDGTDLPGCAKTYLPQPDGGWGMVLRFEPAVSGLVFLAFGERHPRHTWRPSVYQTAHRRLHGS